MVMEFLKSKGWFVRDKSDLLLLTIISAFLERFSFFAHNTALTFLVKDIGISTGQYGLIKTVFGIFLFMGAPVFGRISDVIGSRYCLALALFGGASVYGSIGLSYSLHMLLISQIAAFFCQGIPAHQILVAEYSDDLNRPAAIGKLGMSIGFAVIFGPFFAGQFTALFGPRATFVFLAVLCTLQSAAALQLLPRRFAKEVKPGGVPGAGLFDVNKIKALCALPDVISVLTMTFIVSIPLGIHQSITGLILVEYFQLEPTQIGYVAAFIGISTVVTQGLAIGRLSKMFGEKDIIKGAVLCMAFSFLVMSVLRSVPGYCLAQAGVVCGIVLSLVFLQTLSNKLVDAADRGTMIGLMASTQALAFALGPSVGALVYSSFSLPGYAVFGFTLCAGLFGAMFKLWQ